jgi:hypothetical protein
MFPQMSDGRAAENPRPIARSMNGTFVAINRKIRNVIAPLCRAVETTKDRE